MKSYYDVVDQVNKLLETEGEDAALDYLHDVLDDPETYKILDSYDIMDLFKYLDLGDNDSEYKIDLLNETNVSEYLEMYAEKDIFISILNNAAKRTYLYNENFNDLLYRHSTMEEMVDNNYALAILRNHQYLAPYAIYYVLSSENVGKLENNILSDLLNAYELDETTMYREVLSLLRNPSFVNALSFKQIEELVNRVSTNLETKESKKFVTEVMKIPLIKQRYSQRGRMFNFKYMDKKKVSHVFPLLAKKGYYDSQLAVTDKEKAINMIGYFVDQDPTFFEYFNFRVLNDTVMELDEDLLFGLIKSDKRNKLASIGVSRHGKAFVKCANYLNERYPNANVSSLLSIFEGRHLPEFVYDLPENVDVAMLTHFLLNNYSMQLTSLEQYEYKIMEDLDAEVKNPYGSMEDFKDALCMNRYGFKLQKITDLYRQFGTYIESCDSEELKREFKEFEDIIFGKNKEELYRKYMTNRFSFDKSNKYVEELKRMFSSELDDKVFSQKDLVINDDMYHEGEIVPVVRVTGEFLGLISVLGFVTSFNVIDDDYKKSILSDKNYEIHALSTSLYSRSNPARVTGHVVLGYSDFGPDAIQEAAGVDIYSDSSRYGVHADYTSAFVPPSELPNYTKDSYNELILERRIRDKNSPNHLANIYPSYVFLDNDEPTNVARAVKASKDLGIPIVFYDRKEEWKKYKEEYMQKVKSFTGKSADEFIDVATRLFAIAHFSGTGNIDDLKTLVSKTLKNLNDPSELEKVEAFLMREINKDRSSNNSLVYESIVSIRKKYAPSINLPIVEGNEKFSKLIVRDIQDSLKRGLLTQRYEGRAIKDAYALTHMCAYLYDRIPEVNENYSLKDIVSCALILSAGTADFMYDYRIPTEKRDNEADSIAFSEHARLITHYYPTLEKYSRTLSSFQFNISRYCLSDSNDIRKFFNIALSVVNGEGLNNIARELDIEPEELLKAREEIISIYSNDAKKVASKKK
jgi:hypothetical protein